MKKTREKNPSKICLNSSVENLYHFLTPEEEELLLVQGFFSSFFLSPKNDFKCSCE